MLRRVMFAYVWATGILLVMGYVASVHASAGGVRMESAKLDLGFVGGAIVAWLIGLILLDPYFGDGLLGTLYTWTMLAGVFGFYLVY